MADLDCVSEIDGQRVVGYFVYKDGKSTRLAYPLKGLGSDVSGRCFHNGRFIQRMRQKASTLSNVRLEQGTATSLINEENGSVKGVEYKNGEDIVTQVYAPLTIVCDGSFSNLRRSLCTPKVEIPSCFVGLILENSALPHANHCHVVLADSSPILFYQISSTEIRCFVDIPGQKVPCISSGEMANYLNTVVAPQIPPQLYNAFVAAVEKGGGNIRSMSNRSMAANPHPTPGALLLGDAFNMRHPLTGGGMTVALSDVLLLGDLLRPLPNLNDASNHLQSFYTLRKPVASTINILAGALYKVLCASPDQAKKEMREACFDYLSLGGVFTNGPISLISGLNPRPLNVVLHFFAVTVYGVGRLFLPFPSPKRVWLGAQLLSGAWGIILPIIKAEGVRQMFFPASVPAFYSC
ncbi:hypothetical protein ACS0TY_002802 [Phlomoides rotata]